MKCVILAGGFGSRLSEETDLKPKPMVEIGGRPILWHIMKLYSHYGINDFIICLGYKGYVIKEYFANYFLHTADVTLDLQKNSIDVHQSAAEPWRVSLIDTGNEAMTGGRLRRVKSYIGDETFCLTYGDGVSDVNISALIKKHRAGNKLATVTAIRPPGRFGTLIVNGDNVDGFSEKPIDGDGWINGGFFVLEPSAIDYVGDDSMPWEQEPLSRLSADGQLQAYQHHGFWKCMDTLRDRVDLEAMWQSGTVKWKVW